MVVPPDAYRDHPGLTWMRHSPEGRRFLDDLHRLVTRCQHRWSLRLDPPFPYAHAALALPAYCPDGTEVVLKVRLPDRESEHEGTALSVYAGHGAVRLLAEDPDHHALLLERATPGTPLSQVDADTAMAVLTDLLPRLSVPAGPPFRTLADEAAAWAATLPDEWERAGRPFERRLVDAALDLLTALPTTQGEQVLVHQDLHADNVLRAHREPWLAIDPKPLVGEREFAVTAPVRGPELGHSRRLVRRRLDQLTADLGLDRERARGWTVAQTVAWAFESGTALTSHVEVARWLL